MSNSQTPEPGMDRQLRSTRRRQRQSDGESLKTAPRRKRSKISETTFAPTRDPEEDVVNGSIEVTSSGDIPPPPRSPGRRRGRTRKESTPAMELEMPVRGKKSSVKRPTRGDGATVLTQNERYSVKLLPSTPRELRRDGVEYRGTLGAAHYALAVTRQRAYIWDYTSHGPVSNPRVFDVPFTSKATDPLPFGALVTTGNSTDIGLLLVSAATGKAVFYESIERAASLGLFQERNSGVEGLIGSLFSGEVVTDLTPADHAGFIITLSSGRIVQLTLRDAQGKARIFAQFLRATEQTSGGFFGSIKGFLGGGALRRDVTAVHTRPLGTRGQMQAISLTEKAELQIWDLDWSGRYTFKGTIDCREVITHELKKLESPETQGQSENIAALDFVILDKRSNTNEVTTLGAEQPIDFSILIRSGTRDKCNHVIAEISIDGQEAIVNQVQELTTYRMRSGVHAQSRPRLILPKPGHTAFVAFGDAVVLAAMSEAEGESPEAQLHASYVQPATFEESVHLKQDGGFTVLSSFEEESRSGNKTSSIAFVKGAGLVRFSAVDPTTTDLLARIPIKTEIEQAVFHDALQDGNIIDFSRVDHTAFTPDEVEEAALEISKEVMESKSPFISTSPTSMESHLSYKTHALRALVTYVRQNYPTLSKRAMWRLLWDAEKVIMGQQMWKSFEEHVASAFAQRNKRTATVVDEVCALAQFTPGDNFVDVPSDSDVVRHFFIHEMHRIEFLLPKAYEFLKMLQNEEDKSPHTKIRLVVEADDLWNNAMDAVFVFRMEGAAAYGILPEFLSEGILIDPAEYAELPEFWTSTETMLKAVINMCKVSREIATDEYAKNEQDPAVEQLIPIMGAENPRLIEFMCRAFQERINWLSSRESQKDREMAVKLRQNYDDTRYDQFRALADIAQTEAGLRLAEKYKDMHTLTEMIVAEMQYSVEELHEESSEAAKPKIVNYIDEIIKRIGNYFQRFGDEWADAYFDQGFMSGHAGIMFRDAQEHWQQALTRYLRAEMSRAKICWINDVTAENDFVKAFDSLRETAREQETRLWPKKVELSMEKLALLATQEEYQSNGQSMNEHDLAMANPEGDLEIVHIQERLYQHLLPEILHCIDHQAELEVTMQRFVIKNQDLHSFRHLLEAGFDRTLNHTALSVEELIDVLTLMDSLTNDDVRDNHLQGQEFYLALKVLNAAAPHMPPAHVETLLQLIWKRCYVYDEWIDINSASKQSDDEMGEVLKLTVPWRTLYHALEEGFFDRPDCHVRHLLPSECLSAGCSPEELAYRWPDPDLLDSIVGDNKIHDEQLQGFVMDRRLDQWIEACIVSVTREIEEEGELNAQRLQKERELEERGLGMMAVNGHAKGPNGIKFENGDFGDEDVDME